MKKRTLKGFTLIELIVVLAIFSIILASATSLLLPTMKIMTNAETQESGNAAVTSIGSYIKNELASADNLYVVNDVPRDGTGKIDTAAIGGYVKIFADSYYQGIVRARSAQDDLHYASATFHVIVIDNGTTVDPHNGKISSYVYNADLTPVIVGGSSGIAAPAVDTSKTQTFAINEAYYDNFNYVIKFGNYDTASAIINAPDDFASLSAGIGAANTTVSILAQSKRQVNGSNPSFIYHATTSLVNIAYRNKNNASNRFWVVGTVNKLDSANAQVWDTSVTPAVPAKTKGVVDYADAAADVHYSNVAPMLTETGNKQGYLLIYAYANEIDTTPVP